MKEYIITFHTYLSAMLTYKRLLESKKALGLNMQVVPRKLSSSCGTCVIYKSDLFLRECIDADYEAIYQSLGEDNYKELERNKV